MRLKKKKKKNVVMVSIASKEKHEEACKTSVTNATDWRINHRVYVAGADKKKKRENRLRLFSMRLKLAPHFKLGGL